jgi:hypothetical protein
VAALFLSLLPTRWLLGWTTDVAGLVNFPLRPFQDVASRARDWLRPLPDPRGSMPAEVRALDAQLERARTYYTRLELERDQLLERIALLESTRDGARARSATTERTRFLYATIVATQAPSGRSVGSLVANVGTRQAVSPGMVATWDGDIVAGRIAEPPGRLASLVVPVTALSGVEVRFYPPDRNIDPRKAPGGVLKSMPTGEWTTDLTQPGDVAEGWIARVADERWPLAARGMRIGVVERVGSRDDAPLVRRLTVRSLVDPFRVPHVVLVDDGDAEAAP